jgi:hypothetical protein
MKTNYSLYITFLLTLLLNLGPFIPDVIAQKKARTRMKVYSEKLTNNDRTISIILVKGSGKNMAGVQNGNVEISTFNQDDEITLATLSTDENGEVELVIVADYKLPLDENGSALIKASFAGNDSLRAASKQIKFIDLNVEVSFDIIDSVRQITVAAFELDSLGNKTPSEGVSINIGVQRLYSVLYLQKIKTDEEGAKSIEFPNDIPGDSVGNLNVIIKVNEDKKYGSVTKKSQIDWGTLVDYSDTNHERTLFGDQAPWWMIISVFIILMGAWYHFILAIIKVFKIRSTDQEEALQ